MKTVDGMDYIVSIEWNDGSILHITAEIVPSIGSEPEPEPVVYTDISYTEIKEIGVNSDYPLNGNYRLIDSGTLTGTWVPVGTWASPFRGRFDGNGNTVTISQLNNTSVDNGLFGYIKGATIENLEINIPAQTLDYSAVNDYVTIGALAGTVDLRSTITNVHVTGGGLSVETTSSEFMYVGGLVGAMNMSDVSKVSVEHNITVTLVMGGAGGFAGYASNVDFENSFYNSNVTITGTEDFNVFAGGFVARGSSLDFDYCYSAGDIKSNSPNVSLSGGFLGVADKFGVTTLNHSVLVAGTISSSASGYRNYVIGHRADNSIVSNSASKASDDVILGTGKVGGTSMSTTTSDMTDQNTYVSEFGWDFTDIWEMATYPELQ